MPINVQRQMIGKNVVSVNVSGMDQVSTDLAKKIVTLFFENKVTIRQADSALKAAEEILKDVIISSTPLEEETSRNYRSTALDIAEYLLPVKLIKD